MKFLTILFAIIAVISTTPIGNHRRAKHLNDDDKFNDIISPEALISETVDTESYKKVLELEKDKAVRLDSRFADFNDDNDYREPDIAKLVTSGELLMPKSGQSRQTGGDQAEYGRFFQGDMMLTKGQKKFIVANDGISFPSRTGIIDESYRWEKKDRKVIIPYVFYSGSKYSNQEKEDIMFAMEYITEHTCINFEPRTNEKDFLLIYSGDGCSSYVGKIGGQQLVSLKKKSCFRTGTILHELIHAIGYDHAQNHADRDEHVQIVWDNVKSQDADNFVKVDSDLFSNFDTDYDYYSVMHYDSFAFSKNGKRTIVAKDDDYRDVIGQRYALSSGDVARMNNMYQCY